MSTYIFCEICILKPRCVLCLGASYDQMLVNADISGLYLVQSLDCGVYHNYDTTTAVLSYTLLDNDAESCTQFNTTTHNCILQYKNRQRQTQQKKKKKESKRQ